jgi:hypothetical protein
MSPISRHSLIILAVLSMPAGAHVRAHDNTPSFPPDARASAMPTSKMEMYQQCEEMARLRWGTNNQDMQTPRDFAYRACMYDHGMRNP